MKILLNKIASVTKNANLANLVDISDKITSEAGAIVVVKVLEDKEIYNQLELPSGRMSTIHKGDIIAVALGNRSALKGFVGEVPKKLKVGDIINILNIGGVSGICTSENLTEVGHALKVEVLGSINGLNIKNFRLFSPEKKLDSKVPLILVSGTCMNVGKTQASCTIIKEAVRVGFKIAATKLAGVACLKDTEKMRDYGAFMVTSFIDAGISSTAKSKLGVEITKGAINYLAKSNPDYIVIELGDGVYGEYGVMDILKDKEIQKATIAHIGAAHDPMGAEKLFEVCKKIGLPLDLISGPVTDNSTGTNFIKKKLGVAAVNAMSQGEKLFHELKKSCLKK